MEFMYETEELAELKTSDYPEALFSAESESMEGANEEEEESGSEVKHRHLRLDLSFGWINLELEKSELLGNSGVIGYETAKILAENAISVP